MTATAPSTEAMPADRPSERAPDITVLLMMIAFASLATLAELAAVVSLPVGWVLVAGLVPVVFWALLLREIHRLLRHASSEPTDRPPT